MISIGLLGIKGGVKSRLVLSLIIVGVFLCGCQVPPAPGTSDAAASASPKSKDLAYSEQAEKPAVAEVIESQSVPQEEDVQVDAPLAEESPVETPQVVAEVADAPKEAEPAAAAVIEDVPEKAEPVPAVVVEEAPKEAEPAAVVADLPAKTQVVGTTSPASVVKEAVETVKTVKVPSAKAKIYAVDTVYEFGEITPLEKPTGTFHIKNIGSDVLYLTRVKVCCGARHELSSDELKPGESSVLTVTYVATTIGPFEKYLNVYSNDLNTPDVKLTIKGKVVRRLVWTPERFKLFLDKENGGCLPVKISSTDGKPFSLTLFTATENCLKADIDPNKVAKEFVVYPKVDLEKLGSLKIPKGVVRIGHTHPGCDVIKLNYDLRKRYAFAPKRFLVLNADQRKKQIRRLDILDNYADSSRLNTDGKDSMFTIESVRCEKGSSVLKSTKKLADGFQLAFEVTPPAPGGQRLFQDLITIVLSTGDELQLPVNGIYSPAALSAEKPAE
ncbi:MAG: DUF1573 domain-containing protein [Phycisphaeraceae bacterium]|nr:DUF1573 domain-containing protein [Phycisphaeraceae bacterium]